MQYIKAFTYFTSKPGGGKNLLWGTLAIGSTAIVPLLGQLVWLGYQAETVDELKRDPDAAEYPDFDLNRFVEYLTRCVWPFLTQLIVGFAIAGILLVVVAAAVGVGVVTKEPLAGVAVGLLGYFPLILVGTMAAWPMVLHAQVRREFEFGAALRFSKDFLGKVGGQMFVSVLVYMFFSSALMFLGMLLCIVGIYPMAVIVTMAQEHIVVQLYRLYLDEGGTPIRGPNDRDELDEPDDDASEAE